MTSDLYGRTTPHTNGALTHRISSTGAPHLDGVFKNAFRKKILHYRQIYTGKTNPKIFLTVTEVFASTVTRIYGDFVRLLFLHAHREDSVLDSELPEESDQLSLSVRCTLGES